MSCRTMRSIGRSCSTVTIWMDTFKHRREFRQCVSDKRRWKLSVSTELCMLKDELNVRKIFANHLNELDRELFISTAPSAACRTEELRRPARQSQLHSSHRRWEVLPDPPYSVDLFPKVKRPLHDKHYKLDTLTILMRGVQSHLMEPTQRRQLCLVSQNIPSSEAKGCPGKVLLHDRLSESFEYFLVFSDTIHTPAINAEEFQILSWEQ
ncbi:hypothetical protein Trydic_g3211 [Trypoxylus dichotomus]